MASPTGSQHAAVTYDASTQWLATTYNSIDDYFSNAYASDCNAFTTCALYESDCSTAHNTKAKIDSSSFALSVTQNIDAGYTSTLCIKCANAAGSEVQVNNWVITQNRNCATQLVGSVNGSPLAGQTFNYVDSSTLLTKASGFADFFTP